MQKAVRPRQFTFLILPFLTRFKSTRQVPFGFIRLLIDLMMKYEPLKMMAPIAKYRAVNGPAVLVTSAMKFVRKVKPKVPAIVNGSQSFVLNSGALSTF